MRNLTPLLIIVAGAGVTIVRQMAMTGHGPALSAAEGGMVDPTAAEQANPDLTADARGSRPEGEAVRAEPRHQGCPPQPPSRQPGAPEAEGPAQAGGVEGALARSKDGTLIVIPVNNGSALAF
eukprot:gene4109-4440_t